MGSAGFKEDVLDVLTKNGLETRLQNHAGNWFRTEQVSFFRDDTMELKFDQMASYAV